MVHHFERDIKHDAIKFCNMGRKRDHTLGEVEKYRFYEDLETLLYTYKQKQHYPYDIPLDAQKFMLMEGFEEKKDFIVIPH